MPPLSRKLDDSQLNRVFERVLISLHETGSSPITPQYSSIAELAMRNSAHHELQSSGPSSSWGHAPLPSEISLDSAHVVTGRNSSTPVNRIAPATPMYQHPHRSAVSLQTSPVLQNPASYRRQAFSKPGTADSRNVKDLFRQKPRYQSASFVVTISTPATAILVVAPAPEPNLARFRTWRRVLQRSRLSGLVTTLQRCAWRPCVDTADIRFQ